MTTHKTAEEIIRLVQDRAQGGSARGMSFWTRAAACGRDSVLDGEQRALREVARSVPQAPVSVKDDGFGPPDEISASGAGTVFHLLAQYADLVPEDHLWDTRKSVFSATFCEGLRLWRAYQDTWGTPAQKWGATQMECEVPLPATPEAAARVQELFGDEVTGAMDFFMFIPEENIIGVWERTGLALPGEGWYIGDLKTTRSFTRGKGDKWLGSPQAHNYILQAKLSFPEREVRGMVFDVIDRCAKVKFDAHFMDASEADPRVIRNIVKAGQMMRAAEGGRGLCVPSGCNTQYGPCCQRASGRCPGY